MWRASAYRLRRREPGHFDAERTDEEIWNDAVSEPVAGGWPVVEVETNGPVAATELAARLRAVLRPRLRIPGP